MPRSTDTAPSTEWLAQVQARARTYLPGSETFVEAQHGATFEYEPARGGGSGSVGLEGRAVCAGERLQWMATAGGPPPPASAEALERRTAELLPPLPEHVARYQTALLRDEWRWWASATDGGISAAGAQRTAQLWIRVETPLGAIVEASIAASPEALDFVAQRARLQAACERARAEEAVPPDPSLPWVLRPPVAAPLVMALGTLLRGDVALATPGLLKAVGKNLFPPVLSLEDRASEEAGRHDEEGTPRTSARLIDRGRLAEFLHTRASAAALKVEPNGRATRRGALERALPEALELTVAPGTLALPADFVELATRLETFSVMPRAGGVTLIAAGWTWRGGERTAAVGPLLLTLPVLPTLRTLAGVGSDGVRIDAAGPVWTPSLMFAPGALAWEAA